MSENDFIQRWAEELGCPNPGQICWCGICTNLSKIYKELITETIEAIKREAGIKDE